MSWALEAIEKEALARAFEQIRNTPRTLLLRLESKALILPNLTVNKISENLDERIT